MFVEVRVGNTWEGSEDFMQCVIVFCWIGMKWFQV